MRRTALVCLSVVSLSACVGSVDATPSPSAAELLASPSAIPIETESPSTAPSPPPSPIAPTSSFPDPITSPSAKLYFTLQLRIDPTSDCRNSRGTCAAAYFGYEPIEPTGPIREWQILGVLGEGTVRVPADGPALLPHGTYRFFAHAEPAPVATVLASPSVETINWCDTYITVGMDSDFVDGDLYFGPNGRCDFRLGMGGWQSHPPTPTPISTPTPHLNPDRSIRISAEQVKWVKLAGGNAADYVGAYSAQGPRAAYTADETVYIVDVLRGTRQKVGEFNGTDPVETFVFVGDSVYWMDWTTEVIPDRVPCLAQGPLAWTIRSVNVTTREASMVRSGVHTRDVYCGPWIPAFAVDGDNIALATEGADGGWQVVVEPVAGGTQIRSFSVPSEVESVAMSGTDVAVVYGTRDDRAARTAYFDTHLVVSTSTTPMPVEVAQDAHWVALEDRRLLWMARDYGDPSSSLGELMTATTDDLEPSKLSDIYGAGYSIADGIVGWSDNPINLWDASTGAEARIDPEWDPTQMSAGTVSEGWLTWFGDRHPQYAGPEFMFGIPLDQIPLN